MTGGYDVSDEIPPLAQLLLDPRVDEEEVERLMVEALDQALGGPERIRIPPGTVMIEEGDDVGGIYVVLEGEVGLRRHTADGVQILHSASTGPVVGLLSLTGHRRAFLECRAVTEVLAMPLSVEQLTHALAVEPRLGALLTRVLLTSLDRRLRRADDLQVEVDQLNRALARERDELAAALRSLQEAEAQLVSQARLAMLGELAAGLAHELNNPSAALERAAEHLRDDLGALLGPGSIAAHALDAAHAAPPESTAQARSERRALAAALAEAGLADRALSDRLWRAGVRDVATARQVLTGAAPPAAGAPDQLAQMELGARIGEALRGVEQATERIAALVGSLRAYLQGGSGEEPFVDGVDVAAGVDDALRLLGHRLERVTVERRYEPAPAIRARPGQLQQVWANLIANALDALGGEGRIVVEVAPGDRGGVQVEVVDDGPGIHPDLLERIFEPHFTTKQGQVTYGVGLGLSISRRIVEEHGGSISVASRPGRTVFAVRLPAAPPERPQGAVS